MNDVSAVDERQRDGTRRRAFTVHRGLSLLAAGSLFVVVGRNVPTSSHSLLVDALIISSGPAVIVALVVAAAVIDERRLPRLDIATLVSGLVFQVCQFAGANSQSVSGGTDETLLNRLALRSLLAGHNPYTQVYRLVGADGYGTPLLGGGQANTYGYPPLELEIGRVLGVVSHRFAAPSTVGALAIAALAIGTFLAVPRAWRPLTVIGVLGLGLFSFAALTGESVVLAMALLVLPMRRWTSTGAGGRLGRLGVAQAVSLGLAAAAGQLAWFVTVFLLLALFLVRRGELGNGRAATVVARYTGIAVAAFALVNLPFVLADATAWAKAMASTITQHAIVNGANWALPVIELHRGSDRVGLLGVSAVLLFAASFVGFAAWFRHCARALAVVPSLGFLLSSRSDPTYIFALLPLWLVAAGTASGTAIARARPLTLPRPVRAALATPVRRTAATVALALPAVITFVLGVSGTPPVRMTPVAATITPGRMVRIAVRVENTTDRPLRPVFYVDGRGAVTHPWVTIRGPQVLPPHSEVGVVIAPRTTLEPAPVTTAVWLFATTGSPAGMAAQPMQIPPQRVTVTGLPGNSPLNVTRRLCLARAFSGTHYDCASQQGLSAVR